MLPSGSYEQKLASGTSASKEKHHIRVKPEERHLIALDLMLGTANGMLNKYLMVISFRILIRLNRLILEGNVPPAKEGSKMQHRTAALQFNRLMINEESYLESIT
ncbi:hypothetical protein V6N11_020783 [Hibiscus sabdariffa]|uniref:Uncharacterized protein n=1 Tax=Hibiscus sabdariffa TaxID=183260 RepID=A0ABR2Q9G5_9ROSI